MKVCFGYPEVLQASGALLLVQGLDVAGWIFCVLGLFGLAMRFGIRVQEQEKKKQETEKLFSDLATAGKTAVGLISNVANRDRENIH